MADSIIIVREVGPVLVQEGGPATTAIYQGQSSSGLVPDPGAVDDAFVLRADGTWAAQAGAGGGIDNVVEDTTPQLGGNLDIQSFTIDGRDIGTDGTKLDTIETSATADQSDAEIKTAYENNADTNEFSDAEQTKLSGIETSATADQSNAEIKTAYEANADTNEFSDAEQTKLSGIETSATADQTGAQIKTLYEAEANAFTDTQFTKLSGIETSATADQSDAEIETAYSNEVGQVSGGEKTAGTETGLRTFSPEDIADMAGTHGGGGGGLSNVVEDTTPQLGGNLDIQSFTIDGRDIGTDGTKLDGIETSATADQSDAEIKTAYENNADTNEFSDAEQTKLSGIETSATADQTGAQIKTAYEGESDTNAFTDADESKLDGITAGADVVNPMTTEDDIIVAGSSGTPERLAKGTADQLLAMDGTAANIIWKTVASGGLGNIVEDVTPQLGANLDTQSFTVDGRDVGTDGTKLDTIETSATADQSDAEIKTAYENNADTNAFTDADESKLDALGAGADVVGPGSSTDNAVARFDSTTGKIVQNSGVTIDDSDNIATTGTVDGRDIATDGTKLDGIETSATADQSDAEIETAYHGQVAVVSQVEAEAGTATATRRWTAQRVAQAIAALASGGGDMFVATYDPGGVGDDAFDMDQMSEGSTTKILTDTERTKLSGIEASANNYSHPNHSGDVTSSGDGAQTIAADAVTYAKMQNVVADDVILGNIGGAGGIVDELTATEVRTLINVENGATADQSDAEIAAAYESETAQVSQAEAEAGTVTADRRWTPQRVSQAIAALATGTGDVVGPASATDNAVARFDSTTGKLVQDSGVTVDDSGNIATSGTVDGRDVGTDGTKLDGIEASANNYSHPNHTGDVTSSGDGAQTIAADAVTYAKMQNVVADDVILGNVGGAGGIVDELTATEVRTLINVADGSNNYSHPNHTGDVTSTGDGATVIATDAVVTAKILDANVTLAKIANIATARLLGRNTGGSGVPEELTAATAKTLLAIAVGDVSIDDELDMGAHAVVFDVQTITYSGTPTIDWGLGNKAKLTMTGNPTISFTDAGGACNVILELIQDGTGSRTVGWPSGILWAGGTKPTLTTAANGIDIISFFFDGTNYFGAANLAFATV